MSTAVAGTVIAGITQDALNATLNPPTAQNTFTPIPTSTFIPEPPTLTPTATLVPTLPFTPTAETPLITVSVDTNCRSGPGKVYDMVGALLVGEVADILRVIQQITIGTSATPMATTRSFAGSGESTPRWLVPPWLRRYSPRHPHRQRPPHPCPSPQIHSRIHQHGFMQRVLVGGTQIEKHRRHSVQVFEHFD